MLNAEVSDKLLTNARAERKSGETRRAELVQAALDLLDEVGPEGVTTTAIARRVGLSQAAVFRHFRSKDDIWAAAMDVLGGRIGPRMAAVAQGPGTALERLDRLAREYLRLVEENPAITAFLFYRVPPSGDRTLRDRVAERSGRLQRLMRQLLLESRSAGEIRADVDAEAASALVFGIVQGLLARRHFDRCDETAEDEATRLIALLIAGLR